MKYYSRGHLLKSLRSTTLLGDVEWTNTDVLVMIHPMIFKGNKIQFFCLQLIVWITAQGPIDIRGIMQSTTKKELIRFMIFIMEKNALSMRLEKCPTQRICVIADMEYLSIWQMSYRPGNH